MSAPALSSDWGFQSQRAAAGRLREGKGPWPIWFWPSLTWMVSEDLEPTRWPKVGGVVTINGRAYRVAVERHGGDFFWKVALVPARGWSGWWALWKTRVARAWDELGHSRARIADGLRGKR